MNNQKPTPPRIGVFGKVKSPSSQPAAVSEPARRAIRAAILFTAAMFLIGIGVLYISLPVTGRQSALAIAIPWLIGLAAMGSIWLIRRRRINFGLWLIIVAFLASILGESLLVSGFGLLLGVAAFALSTTLAMRAMSQKHIGLATLVSALVGAAAVLLDYYGPAGRQTATPESLVFIVIVTGIIALVFVAFVVRQFRNFNLQPKIITAFVLVALSTLLGMAITSYYITRNALIAASNRALETGAKETALAMDDFLSINSYTVSDEAKLPEFSAYLSLLPEQRAGSEAEKNAYTLLRTLREKQYIINKQILAYALLDINGVALMDTSTTYLGQFRRYLGMDKIDPTSFKLMRDVGYPFVSPVMFSAIGDQTYLFFAARVVDANNTPIGILVSRYNGDVLQDIATENNDHAGPGSFAILYDEEGICLAHGLSRDERFKAMAPLASMKIAELQAVERLPLKLDEEPFINIPSLAEGMTKATPEEPFFTSRATASTDELHSAAVAILRTRNWKIAYFQPQSSFLTPIQEQTQATILLALLFAAIATGAAAFVSAQLARPITSLTAVAKKVTAGDLLAQARVMSRDEIGTLAIAFNAMTTELRQTLEGLEHRVAERTSELAKASEQMKKRANQLQAVAEAAHAIASIRDPEQLLQIVTRIVSERFSFYHVGIFMLDKPEEYAVLQAANSEGGQRMLARGHRLKKGQGIVGFVAAHGEPRLALDVGSDAVFFDNPDLPYTRSEMALPLKVGGKVIGALDVQSIQPSAFTEEDVEVLGTLADQVSIAIENARLYTETRAALTELQSLHAQYLQTAWSQAVVESGKSGYEYRAGKVAPLPLADVDDLWSVIESGTPTVVVTPPEEAATSGESPPSALVAPITVRGQVIGMFHLGETERGRFWDEEDISLIKAIADQVGLALENARLLEQTQRRAEREHLVADITGKLRATNDPQAILQTAVSELRQALRAKHAQIIVQPTLAPSWQRAPASDTGSDGHGEEESEARR